MTKKALTSDMPVFRLAHEDSKYELLQEMIPNTDTAGREYEMVTQTIENLDFYQGLNMITVIRRKSDGKLFGFSWFDDISKHGESYMESNGYDFDIEHEGNYSYFVFEPVKPYTITSYEYLGDL